MIDIIYAGITNDIAINLRKDYNSLIDVVPEILRTGNRDYVSYIEAREDVFINNIRQIIDEMPNGQ
jgi:hypothetical protein